MQITKLFFGFAVLFLCLVFNGGFVIGQETKGTKNPRQHGNVNHGGSFAPKNATKDEVEESVHHALEELKLLTGEVTKKASINKNVIIGSALAQTALLLVVTALVGYSLKDNNKKGGSEKEKPSKGPEAPESE